MTIEGAVRRSRGGMMIEGAVRRSRRRHREEPGDETIFLGRISSDGFAEAARNDVRTGSKGFLSFRALDAVDASTLAQELDS